MDLPPPLAKRHRLSDRKVYKNVYLLQANYIAEIGYCSDLFVATFSEATKIRMLMSLGDLSNLV